jgi:hypothetical protein
MPKIDLLTKYPEHAKLDKVKDKSQTIGEFLEWLSTKRREVAVWAEPKEPPYLDKDGELKSNENYMPEGWYPLNYSIEKLLAEYFEIDLNKLESEKRQMLDEIRSKNK